jgi:tetratricopeptide (TPR) repeat protein
LRTGRATQAEQECVERRLTAVIKEHPESPVLPAILAQFHEVRGHHQEAMALYRKVLQREPGNVMALNNLAYLLALKEGKTAEALELIQSALDRAGPASELLDTRALVYLSSNQADLAARDLEQAVLQSPSPSTYFHLARAYHQAKNRRAAREAFAKANDLGLKAGDLQALERPALEQLTSALDAR